MTLSRRHFLGLANEKLERTARAQCGQGCPRFDQFQKKPGSLLDANSPAVGEKRSPSALEDELGHHLRTASVVLLVRRCNLTKGRLGRVDYWCATAE